MSSTRKRCQASIEDDPLVPLILSACDFDGTPSAPCGPAPILRCSIAGWGRTGTPRCPIGTLRRATTAAVTDGWRAAWVTGVDEGYAKADELVKELR